jgi:hypothetical protein
MSEAAAPPAATAGSGGGGGGGTGEAQAQAQGTSESASESESGSEVEVDPNDIEEDEDDEDEEEDDDEEDDDEGSSDEEYDSEGEEEEDELASVSLRALLASLPLLADYTPPPLDNDLAEELAARTGAAAARGGAPRAGTPCARHGGQRVVSPAAALALRETGGGGGGGGGAAGCGTHIAAFHRLPTRATAVVDRMQSRGYIGRFTSDGEIFVGEATALAGWLAAVFFFLLHCKPRCSCSEHPRPHLPPQRPSNRRSASACTTSTAAGPC